MRKSVVKNLEPLKKLVERFEEAIEENFTHKQVAIIKMRLGIDGGSFMYAKDVAKKLKVSESWVNKTEKDIRDFVKELAKKAPRVKVRKARSITENTGAATQTVGLRKVMFKGRFNIANGDVEVEADGDSNLGEVEAMLSSVAESAREGYLKTEIASETRRLAEEASNKFFGAFLGVVISVIALLIGLVTTNNGSHADAAVFMYTIAALSAAVGLSKYISGVSLRGERRGLLRVREL